MGLLICCTILVFLLVSVLYFVVEKKRRQNYTKVISSLIKEFVSINIVLTLWRAGYNKVYNIAKSDVAFIIISIMFLSIITLALITINNLDDLKIEKYDESHVRGWLFFALIICTAILFIVVVSSYDSLYAINDSIQRNIEKYGMAK